MKSLLTVLSLVALSAAVSTQAPPIAVHVTTQAVRDGFSDPDLKARTDSVRDLQRALSTKKGLVLVDEREAATVVLEVLGRAMVGTGERSGTAVRDPLTGLVLGSSSEKTGSRVTATLRVGRYETPIEGNGALAWRDAADDLAGKVDTWVKENRERLSSP